MKLEDAKKDYYRRLAREEGYNSRAAYKLLETVKRYKLIKPGDKVLDLGCAPGGWVQVASEAVGENGMVIGVDLAYMRMGNLPNVKLIQGDIIDPQVLEKVKTSIDSPREFPFDALLSDLSPNISGVWELDHFKQVELTFRSLDLGDQLLRVGGNAMLKVFDGERFQELRREAGKRFQTVTIVKPRASRSESSELYLVCLAKKRA